MFSLVSYLHLVSSQTEPIYGLFVCWRFLGRKEEEEEEKEEGRKKIPASSFFSLRSLMQISPESRCMSKHCSSKVPPPPPPPPPPPSPTANEERGQQM